MTGHHPWSETKHKRGEDEGAAAAPAGSTPPTVISATLSPNPAVPGKPVTMTVQYAPGTSLANFTVTVAITDKATGVVTTAPATGQIPQSDPTSATGCTDTLSHTWSLVSDNGSTAVYSTPSA